QIAIKNGHLPVVDVLLYLARSSPSTYENETSTHAQNSILDVDYRSATRRETALYLAARKGSVEMVELLVTKGRCDINIPNYRGRTPLFVACRNGHIEVVKFLLS